MPDDHESTVASLVRSLEFHLEYARRLVADLAPGQMTAVPGPGHENHPAFTIGHLVTALDMVAQDLGLSSELRERWGELFLRRGPADRRTPSTAVDAGHPSREDLLEELARQTRRVTEALERADAAWFSARSEPWKLSKYLPTNLDGVLFMATTHSALHLGQLAAWRRAMGLPAAMAGM